MTENVADLSMLDIPETVTVSGERFARMCFVGLTMLHYMLEVAKEPENERHAAEQQQRIEGRFLDLIEAVSEMDVNDYTLPWAWEDAHEPCDGHRGSRTRQTS